jgi:hypothetical protein
MREARVPPGVRVPGRAGELGTTGEEGCDSEVEFVGTVWTCKMGG